MKWIDYREKLGIGFCDSVKVEKLNNKISIFLSDIEDMFDDYTSKNVLENIIKYYFITVGEKPHYGHYTMSAVIRSITEHANISETVSKYVAFAQSFSSINSHDKRLNKYVENILAESLEALNIAFKILEDADGKFYFPCGAKELDDALVSQPLDWLEDYPRSRKTFTNALKQYSEKIYIRDTADNFRKALEEFFQEFLSNTKNLDNNITEVFKYLKDNNAEPELAAMMKTLINTYDNLNNKIAKHNDKVDARYLEFLMYQTGIFIRLLVVIKNSTK